MLVNLYSLFVCGRHLGWNMSRDQDSVYYIPVNTCAQFVALTGLEEANMKWYGYRAVKQPYRASLTNFFFLIYAVQEAFKLLFMVSRRVTVVFPKDR